MSGSAAVETASRPRVVGSIVAGSLIVGLFGAVSGYAFDPEPHRRTDVIQPTVETVPGSTGRSAVGAAAVLPRVDDGTVTLQEGVQVVVPPGWHVTGQREATAALADGRGNVAFALTGRVDPTSTAGGLVTANLPGMLPPETYTQQRLIGMGDITLFGSVTSAAYLEYEALVADNQGSLRLHGQIYGAVRRDGIALLLLVEHEPAESWNESGFPAVRGLVNDTYALFASG